MHQVGSERSSSPSIIDGNIVIIRHGRRCFVRQVDLSIEQPGHGAVPGRAPPGRI
jgi:hypothetical protein